MHAVDFGNSSTSIYTMRLLPPLLALQLSLSDCAYGHTVTKLLHPTFGGSGLPTRCISCCPFAPTENARKLCFRFRRSVMNLPDVKWCGVLCSRLCVCVRYIVRSA